MGTLGLSIYSDEKLKWEVNLKKTKNEEMKGLGRMDTPQVFVYIFSDMNLLP